jgi:hypothetical protein
LARSHARPAHEGAREVSGIGVAELERDVDDPSAGIAAHSLRHVEVRPRDDACEADTIGALRTLADRQHQEGVLSLPVSDYSEKRMFRRLKVAFELGSSSAI